jgi:hypothetical protein
MPTNLWIFKWLESCWVAGQLTAAQQGFSSVKLVIYMPCLYVYSRSSQIHWCGVVWNGGKVNNFWTYWQIIMAENISGPLEFLKIYPVCSCPVMVPICVTLWLTDLLPDWLTYLLPYLLTDWLTYWLTYLLTYWLTVGEDLLEQFNMFKWLPVPSLCIYIYIYSIIWWSF